jgi:hypothetical protein
MRLTAILFSAIVLCSCELKVKTPEKEKTSVGNEKPYSRNKNRIRNEIELGTIGGVKVEQAFLTYADDGSLIDEQNITELGRKITLHLVIDGWKADGDKAYLEASEKVTSNEGDVIFEDKNLFKEYDTTGVSLSDAKLITLNVGLKKVNKLFDFFIVDFSIWNEKASQSIKGKYKFYINNM